MASQSSSNEGGPSTLNVSSDSSDSTVHLNVKTLDSRIYTFQVHKNMPVSQFKEKIANEIGVPVSQQRLIFRGKVLKDEHVLSEYHFENGHTLHLVERQPNQSQTPGTGSGETTSTTSNRGNDVGSGAPRNRVGQISHSVVLGTFNVGEQGEGISQDLTRVIGAVLNSFANGGQNTINVPNSTQNSSAPAGNETEGNQAENQSLAGNQAPSGQAFSGQAFQSRPHVVQIPMAAGAIPVPSFNAPIPDSLSTLSEFINRMEHTLSQNGYGPNVSSTNLGDQQAELPSNTQGLPTLEALTTVLHRAEQLLSGQAVSALSHIAGRMEREGTSADLGIRGQIQSESAQIGIAMQHLGALLLELGRTMLTLRMGRSPAESVVNAGPAVYISPSGPNPIMAQPFPLQTSSLFGGPLSSTPATLGTVGVGSAPRNVNIHIHAAGASLAPIVSAIGSRPNNGEGTRTEHRSEPGSGVSGSTRVLPVRNVMSATLPSNPSGTGAAGSTPTGFSISTSQLPPDSAPLSSVLAEIHSRLRNSVGNMQGDSTVLSGQMQSANRDLSSGSEPRPAHVNEQRDTGETNGCGDAGASSVGPTSESGVEKSEHNQPQTEAIKTCSNDERDVLIDKFVSSSSNQDLQSCSSGETTVKSEKVQEAPTVSERRDVTEPAKTAPLGLGVSGLERKKRTRLQPPVGKAADDGSSSSSINRSQEPRTDSQNILQTLASQGSAVNLINADRPSSQRPIPSGGSQIDVAGLMSQVLHSPALNGLLEGFSQQTGVDSPDGLRNMLQQFTQSPQMMNTVNQIAQHVGSQDMGNMLTGTGRGQGGGVDFSRMFQQMMPIVSQALGGGNPPSLFSAAEPETRAPYRNENSDNQSLQLDLQPVVERIDRPSPPRDVFRAVAENAVQLSGSGSASDDLLDELCCNESLASEYMEMLRYDVNQLLEGRSKRDKS
ncbi:ubiquitin-like domain-containing protein CIP73 isoform X1 [Trifolium pratense]|uniref:ubiquitin-like domain-containing protein CIP73 isoform X1 n=1 Tax=Trifolium pratense TaxID=57577 RepID=UPI001E6945FF|nr:ubiquitin-like domain-containing protein CIP73 isoform X1 [Trifolium pratense]